MHLCRKHRRVKRTWCVRAMSYSRLLHTVMPVKKLSFIKNHCYTLYWFNLAHSPHKLSSLHSLKPAYKGLFKWKKHRTDATKQLIWDTMNLPLINIINMKRDKFSIREPNNNGRRSSIKCKGSHTHSKWRRHLRNMKEK